MKLRTHLTTLHRMTVTKNSTPTAINISNFNCAKDNLFATYESKQKKYIQDKIYEITNETTSQNSLQASKVVNEINGRKIIEKILKRYLYSNLI